MKEKVFIRLLHKSSYMLTLQGNICKWHLFMPNFFVVYKLKCIVIQEKAFMFSFLFATRNIFDSWYHTNIWSQKSFPTFFSFPRIIKLHKIRITAIFNAKGYFKIKEISFICRHRHNVFRMKSRISFITEIANTTAKVTGLNRIAKKLEEFEKLTDLELF